MKSYKSQSTTPLIKLRNSTSRTATREMSRLITLFTTFKHYEGKGATYRNTIRNWALLAPFVRPVLYYPFGEDYLTEFARTNGWSVYKCPRLSKHGVPVLRSMFLHAQEINATTSFYGYANGDILFNNNLVVTLEALRTDNATFKQVLVVGRRTNYMFKDKEEIYNLEPVYRYATAGKLFRTDAQDFFISTHSGFPWDSIPDFVVGRVGYDNWLVANALNTNVSVIDVTATVTALHQTSLDGNFAGHRKQKGDDYFVNYRLAKDFDYSNGVTTCANLITRWRISRRVVILKRPDVLRKGCVNPRRKSKAEIRRQTKLNVFAAAALYRAYVQGKQLKHKKVLPSKFSRLFRTASKASELQKRAINPSAEPTTHATIDITSITKSGEVSSSSTTKSRNARLPTSKHSQVSLPTTISETVKHATILLSQKVSVTPGHA